jgi:hypothetical protein
MMDYKREDFITYAQIKHEFGMSRDAVMGRAAKTGVKVYSMRRFVPRGNAPHAILKKDLEIILNFKENLIEKGISLVEVTRQTGRARQTIAKWVEDLEIKTHSAIGGVIHISLEDAQRLLNYVPDKSVSDKFGLCQTSDIENIKQGLYHKVMPNWTMNTHQGFSSV